MELFDVYPLLDVEPVKGEGSFVYDKSGNQYLDFYGGHAVISIGHSHPHYLKKIIDQAQNLGFYSNSVQMPLQNALAHLLGKISGYEQYRLFLCNSGAEANENALKLASFKTGKKKVIAFENAFHGRTSAAVAVTDNKKYKAPINESHEVIFLPLNDTAQVKKHLSEKNVAAVIIEGIQGVAGINVPEDNFLQELQEACRENEAVLILDEVQSGYGRTGKFFAHQYSDIEPDLITVAKGMGNGFPIAGVLINPSFQAVYGMLGTTFGGNHLACAAGLAVLEVIEQESLIEHARTSGNYLINKISGLTGIKEVRGRGLMIGIELNQPAEYVRKKLLEDHRIFTGSSSQPSTLRLLPALNVSREEADQFLTAFKKIIKE